MPTNPFDDPRVGLGAGWPNLKVADVRIMTVGGSALARDMLRTYTQLNADATCDLLIGPGLSYFVIALRPLVERPFWMDFASARVELANIPTYARLNPNLDDLARIVVGIVKSLEAMFEASIPSVTILASPDAYSQELTSFVMRRLAMQQIEVEFIVTLELDATPQQAQQALEQLRTASSRVVLMTLFTSKIVNLWSYVADAALAAVAANQFDLISVLGAGHCGIPPFVPGMLCGVAELNSTQAKSFPAALSRQPQAFSDDVQRRLRAMKWPDVPVPDSLVKVGVNALIIDAVTFGLGALSAFAMQNNRLPHNSSEMRSFAVQGSTTNKIDGPRGYVEPDGVSGLVHLDPNGNRLGASIQIFNYQLTDIVRVGSFDFESDKATIDRNALYLRGGYYVRPLRTPPDFDVGQGAGRTRTHQVVIPAVLSVLCGSTLIAAAVVGCCWWRRRRWPSREEKLALRNKWAVRAIMATNSRPIAAGAVRDNGVIGATTSRPAAPPDLALRPTARVTIVWTDIDKSTALWAQLPHAMGPAIDAHHALMRAVVTAHHGYEARNVGDASMLVFGNAADAVEFAMVLQVALVNDVPWAALAGPKPPPLPFGVDLQPPQKLENVRRLGSHGLAGEPGLGIDPFETFYRADSARGPSLASGAESPLRVRDDGGEQRRLWAGLRVRTGVATGMAAVKMDAQTGAYDYSGPVVDAASRLCLVARGGQTVMTELSLRAALSHSGLDPGRSQPPARVLSPTQSPTRQHRKKQQQQQMHSPDSVISRHPTDGANQRRHHRRRSTTREAMDAQPSMALGWLRPSETIGSQVPKQLPAAPGAGPALTIGSDTIIGSDVADAQLMVPPRAGRAPPYVRSGEEKGGLWRTKNQRVTKPSPTAAGAAAARTRHVFPASTHVTPLGVYALRGGRGVASYECLYQALPSQLAGRSFAPLRLHLIPGLVKCRDAAEGQASDETVGETVARVKEPAAARSGKAPPPPQAAAVAAADVIIALESGHRVDTGRLSAAPVVSPAVDGVGTASLKEAAAHGLVRRAMTVLVDVLLAPLAPQARYSMLSEISSGWRLPPPAVVATPPAEALMQQNGETVAATTATNPNGPQMPADVIAVECLADRCAAVYLSSRRPERRSIQ
jgi:class 3 adenylate cyclase